MTPPPAAGARTVIRMSPTGAILIWLLYVPFSVAVALVPFAYAVSGEGPGWLRIAAGVAALAVLAHVPWFIRGARPRRHLTLELVLDGDGVTGRQLGQVHHVPRPEIWFVEIREVTPVSGVVFVGIRARDGELAAGWMPNWGLNVSSRKVRRLVGRAGYPWVLVLNDRVWSSEGVGDDACAVAGSPP